MAVFFEVYHDESDLTEYIALTKRGITYKEIIVLNCRYVFSGLKKCSWKRSKAAKGHKNVTDEIETITESTVHWYIGDDSCVVTTCGEMSNAEVERIRHESTVLNTRDHLTALNESECAEMVQPSSTYLKDFFSSKEIVIEGTVSYLDPSGWIELFLLNPVLPGYRSRLVNVFIIHYSRSDTTEKLLKGVKVRISFVFPIYLWGKLRGFAATVRSHIEIMESGDQSAECGGQGVRSRVSRKRDRKDLSTPSSCSKRVNQDTINLTDEVVSIVDIDSPAVTARLYVPQELKARCHMFAAWRAYLEKKYTISISQSLDTPPSDARRVNSKPAKDRSSDRVPFLTDQLMRIIERGRSRNRSCLCDRHKKPESSIICSDCSCGFAGSAVSDLTLLPPTRSVQEEFMSAQYTELYSIRCSTLYHQTHLKPALMTSLLDPLPSPLIFYHSFCVFSQSWSRCRLAVCSIQQGRETLRRGKYSNTGTLPLPLLIVSVLQMKECTRKRAYTIPCRWGSDEL